MRQTDVGLAARRRPQSQRDSCEPSATTTGSCRASSETPQRAQSGVAPKQMPGGYETPATDGATDRQWTRNEQALSIDELDQSSPT